MAEDSWIVENDPDGVDPSLLRFGVGSRVMHKRDNGWFEGEVLKVCQRLVTPPEVNKKIFYVVLTHLEDADDNDWVEEDSDDYIRPRLEDLSPDRTKFNPKLVPALTDPMAYLYTGVTLNPCDPHGNEIALALTALNYVCEAKTNADGSTNIKYMSGRGVNSCVVEIPQEPMYDVPGHAIMKIATNLSRRRQCSTESVFAPVKMFETIVPTETSLEELEEAAKLSNEKMLLLADSLMSGVHGWSRDPMRACSCYRAAAWGCQESDEHERLGIPVGLPEAMMQTVYTGLIFMKKECMALDLWYHVSTTELIKQAIRNPRGLGLLSQIFYWTYAALRRGYVSPTVYDLATVIRETNLVSNKEVNDDIKDIMQPILNAFELREMEIKYEKLQKQGAVPRGQPSNSTIGIYSRKAKEIFHNLPITAGAIHIEYRKVPRDPFPVVAYAIHAERKELVCVVQLPGNIQVSAFSQESFRFVWLRIAFSLHLGKMDTEERIRPTEFTILDYHGNREFASYLQNEIDGSGTAVHLVSDSERIECGKKRNQREKLGDIVRQVENRLLDIPGFLIDNESAADSVISSAQQAFIRQYARDTFAQVGNDEKEIRNRSEQLKTQGNDLFSSSDYSGAARCYSISIQLLKLLIDHDNESYLLLETLLSNRAACFLEMEGRRSSLEFQNLFTQNAIRDCTVALEFSWSSTVLNKQIIDRLKFRRDKAISRLDVLRCEFQSVAATPTVSQETTTDTPQQAAEEQDVASSPRDTVLRSESAADNEPSAKPAIPEQSKFDALLEYGHVIYENSLAKNSIDGCPICIRQFNGEISHTLSVVLPCGEHALCVECVCILKKQSDKDDQSLACPMCRASVKGQFVENLALQIMEVNKKLAISIEKFPANSKESVSAAQQLLWKQDFRVDAVVDALEDILDDRARGVFFRTENDLSHENKESIYRMARQPVDRFKGKLQKLLVERKTTFEANRLYQIDIDIRTVRSDLTIARFKARDEICEKLNSVGDMGAQLTTQKDTIQVDLHGLHIAEMHIKFSELIKPILPVVKKIT
jgi:hypothetical protein